jgi:toxin ParE1/3/4
MRRYEISQTANYDLAEIVDYLSDQSFESGEQFIKKFSQSGILIDRYIVFYQVTDEAITIVRVIRGDRDLTALF